MYNGYVEGDIKMTDARGEIVSFSPPKKLKKGEEVRIPTTIKNAGGEFGEFRMYLFDDDTGEEIEHEPKYTWKNLNPGETYTATLDSEWWYGAMPYHDWNLRIEVRKQSTPYVSDDTKQFTVELDISIIGCLFPRIYIGNPFPRITQADPLPRVTCIVAAISK